MELFRNYLLILWNAKKQGLWNSICSEKGRLGFLLYSLHPRMLTTRQSLWPPLLSRQFPQSTTSAASQLSAPVSELAPDRPASLLLAPDLATHRPASLQPSPVPESPFATASDIQESPVWVTRLAFKMPPQKALLPPLSSFLVTQSLCCPASSSLCCPAS